MGRQVIHIYGASGSGTSTLGRYLCDRLGYFFIDTDDYFWKPTNPPYQIKRDPSDRLTQMAQDILSHDQVVISGSLVDWGDPLIPLFTLAIRLETNTAIRLQRIKERERKRFGSRIDPGGDLYKTHQEFIAWAASYDHGDFHTRSKAKHDAWEKQLPCSRILLDGSQPLDKSFERILPFLHES